MEPAANVAEAARARGIPTEVQFLGDETGREIARQHGRADLVAANNVFAHVPDIRGFAAGLRALVKDEGMVTLEFPHLLRLIERAAVRHDLSRALLLPVPADLLPRARDGRVARGRRGRARHARRIAARLRPPRGEGGGEPTERVKAVLAAEEAAGLHTVSRPRGVRAAVLKIKSDLLDFLITAAREGQVGGRLRRAGQGQHAAEPLRHQVGSALLHGGPFPW